MSNDIRQLKLENLLKETLTLALFEQAQAALPTPPPPVSAGSPVPPPPQTPQDPAQQMPPPTTPPPGGEELTMDSMIERLNVIRGGKSFTDPEIYGQITTYFKTLTPENKSTIDAFLQSISKIMVNVRQGGTEEQPMQPEVAQQAAPNSGAQPPISATPNASPAPAMGASGMSGPGGM